MRRWIALYSHTGEEIRTVSDALHRRPDLVLTTCKKPSPYLSRFNVRYGTAKQINQILRDTLTPQDIVTLHGYMRIIPESVIRKNAPIYNGHPGLITRYPELKGKDPQVRAMVDLDQYEYIGCVLHRVTEDLDGGPIISFKETPVTEELKDSEQAWSTFRAMSALLWVDFLKGVLECRD